MKTKLTNPYKNYSYFLDQWLCFEIAKDFCKSSKFFEFVDAMPEWYTSDASMDDKNSSKSFYKDVKDGDKISFSIKVPYITPEMYNIMYSGVSKAHTYTTGTPRIDQMFLTPGEWTNDSTCPEYCIILDHPYISIPSVSITTTCGQTLASSDFTIQADDHCDYYILNITKQTLDVKQWITINITWQTKDGNGFTKWDCCYLKWFVMRATAFGNNCVSGKRFKHIELYKDVTVSMPSATIPTKWGDSRMYDIKFEAYMHKTRDVNL